MKPVLILSVILSLLVSCSQPAMQDDMSGRSTGDGSVTLSLTEQQEAGIAAGPPVLRQLNSVIRVSGKVEIPPQNIVSVGMPMAGFLRESDLLPGMHVRRGDLLGILEDQQYLTIQEEYLKVKVSLAAAEPEYRRQKLLADSSASSVASMERARAQHETLIVTRNALAERLRLLNIDPATLGPEKLSPRVRLLSPVSGVVSRVNMNRGVYAQPGEVLFEIIDPGDVHLVLRVFERDLASITAGQKVTAFPASKPSQVLKAEVLLVGPVISADRTAEVHCHFTEGSNDVVPGTIMNAEILSPSVMAPVLPRNAIVGHENSQYIFLKRNDRFVMQAVTTGNSDSLWTEIREPAFQAGDSVVLTGAYALLMKLKNTQEE